MKIIDRFYTSLHYDLILAILLLISFLAIIGMYSFVRLNVNIFIRISVIYSFITLVLFWLDFGKYGFKFTLIKRVKKNSDKLIEIIGWIICAIIWVILVFIGGITGVSMIISMIIVVIISGIIEKIIGRTIQSLKPLFLLIILCYPFISVIYFVHYTLIDLLFLGGIQILLFWLTILGIGGTVYWRVKTLDYEAKNPLKGILDNTINN